MTNKEAIHALRHLYRNCSWNEITCEEYGCESCEDALNMAIESLQDTRGKANHVVAEIKVDTDEIMERLEQEWYKPNEWIPCSERLPEVGRCVLLSVGGLYTAEGCLRDDGDWNQFRWDAIQRRDMVGAWMPLPKPYKEGDSDDNQ